MNELPENLVLEGSDIHLWWSKFAAESAGDDKFWALLSGAEHERADRFRFAVHRKRFVICRGMLRKLLSAYKGIPPDSLQFSYNRYGKPELQTPVAAEPLHFNVSHSDQTIVIALTRAAPLGVDVEYMRRKTDYRNIAKRFFATAEWEDLCNVPQALRRRAFYNCWTRKEAYIKALGSGLSTSLNSFVVTLRPEHAPRVVLVDGDPRQAKDWSLYHFNPDPDTVGALAIKHPNCRLEVHWLNMES